MRAADYFHKADRVVGFSNEIERANHALAAAKRRASFNDFVLGIDAARPKYIPWGIGTAAGAAAGAYFAKDHRVLGAIGGASLATNVPALFHPATRNLALCNLLESGGAIAGSIVIGGKTDSALRKVLGAIAGYVAARIVSHVGGLDK